LLHVFIPVRHLTSFSSSSLLDAQKHVIEKFSPEIEYSANSFILNIEVNP